MMSVMGPVTSAYHRVYT